jgi:hypothetical protein
LFEKKEEADDQKTIDAVSEAKSGAQGWFGGTTDDVKSEAKDIQKKAGKSIEVAQSARNSASSLILEEKADHIEAAIEVIPNKTSSHSPSLLWWLEQNFPFNFA